MNEIHITVNESYASFRDWVTAKFPSQDTPTHSGRWCIKVHHYVNHARPDPIEDVFTSELCSGSIERAIMVADNRAAQVRNAGFTPARVKIECEPWDHLVAGGQEYYETHLDLLGAMPGAVDLGVRRLLLSTNVRKRAVTGTIRSSDCTLEQHLVHVDKAARGLLSNRVIVLRATHEFVAYDSCRERDKVWEDSTRG